MNINRSTVNLPFSLLSIYYFPNTLSVLSYTYIPTIVIFPFCLHVNGLLVYDPLHLILTWFAWFSQRIFFQYLSIFLESTLEEFPSKSRHLYWTLKARHFEVLEQITKSSTSISFYKYRALSFSIRLLRSAILVQPCRTPLFPSVF